MPGTTPKIPTWIKVGAIAGFASAALSVILLFWVIALQGSVSNLAESSGEFLSKKFSLKESPINADFEFDLPNLGGLIDLIWSPGGIIACFVLYLIGKKLHKKFFGPRRRRPASATPSA